MNVCDHKFIILIMVGYNIEKRKHIYIYKVKIKTLNL